MQDAEVRIPAKQLEHSGTFGYLKMNLVERECGWCTDDNLLYVKDESGKLVPHSKIIKLAIGAAYAVIKRYVWGNSDFVGGVIPIIEGAQGSGYRYLYPERLERNGILLFSAIADGKYYWASCSPAGTWSTGEKTIVFAPAPPSAGEYVLKSIDGVIQWESNS